MVIIYVVFEAITSSDYRVRTGSDDIEITTPVITLTSNAPAGSTADEVQAPSVFLGIEVMSVNEIVAEQLEIDKVCGVLINLVVPNSPANIAGLERGDVILSLNNNAIKDIDSFKDALLKLDVSEVLRIAFIRDGIKDSTYANLVPAANTTTSTATASISIDEAWGISLSPLTDVLKETYAIPSNINGIIVLSVEPNGLADNADISSGDIIIGVDKIPVVDMSSFFNAIASDINSTALLNIYSQGRTSYIPIDSSSIINIEQIQAPVSLSDKILSFFSFTGGIPFTDDDEEEEEEGPKGGKFAPDDDENIALTADNSAYNRPDDPPGEENATGTSSTGDIALNRPTTVPGQTTTTGSNNDITLFIGLLLLIIIYLLYREYER